jgi:hypothetical protein
VQNDFGWKEFADIQVGNASMRVGFQLSQKNPPILERNFFSQFYNPL